MFTIFVALGIVITVIGALCFAAAIYAYACEEDEEDVKPFVITGVTLMFFGILMTVMTMTTDTNNYNNFIKDFYVQQAIVEEICDEDKTSFEEKDYIQINKAIELNKQLKGYQAQGKALDIEPIELP